MFRLKVAIALIVLAGVLTSTRALAQEHSPSRRSNHRVDRFVAIHELQESLKHNPKDTAGWIVLGELAHEVAQDLSSTDDQPYYKISVEAFEKAAALQPNNTAIKAALEFARDELAGAAQWDLTRKQAAHAYVETREHELVAARFSPAVLSYPPPRASIASVEERATSSAPRDLASAATSAPSRQPAPPAAPAAATPAPTTNPAYVYAYVPYYVQVPQYTYTAPTYTTPYTTVAPFRGAHRRRSER
jgi:hypothetical protein